MPNIFSEGGMQKKIADIKFFGPGYTNCSICTYSLLPDRPSENKCISSAASSSHFKCFLSYVITLTNSLSCCLNSVCTFLTYSFLVRAYIYLCLSIMRHFHNYTSPAGSSLQRLRYNSLTSYKHVQKNLFLAPLCFVL